MHPVIYDVAVSLDGYISGPAGDISKFAHEGPVVDDYMARMGTYSTAIMGRTTYEFGYDYGLTPGQNPYPNMQTHVFSRSLECPEDGEISVVRSSWWKIITDIKQTAAGPVYLCGGGQFAGWLLEQGLIDQVVLKRAPQVLGAGVKLFADASPNASFQRTGTKSYENGYLLEEFRIRYLSPTAPPLESAKLP